MSTIIKRNGDWYKIKDIETGLEYYRSVPVFTGKRWIDSKPIYSLAIHVNNVPETPTLVFDTGLGENIGDCIRFEAVLQGAGVGDTGRFHIESLGTPDCYDKRHNHIWLVKKSSDPSVWGSGTIWAKASSSYSITGAPESKIIIQMEFTLTTDTADTTFTKVIKRAGTFKKSNCTLIKHNGVWVNVYQNEELYQFKLNKEVYTGSHWLDGKPIYAKVIKGKTSADTFPNTAQGNTYTAGIASNFKDMVDVWGIIQNTDHVNGNENVVQIAGEIQRDSPEGSLCWYDSTADIIHLRGEGTYGNCDAYAILFYTKQTDTDKPITNIRDTCSTEEIFTGRYWIDGKKIYRKCYDTLWSGSTPESSEIAANSISTGLPANTIKNMVRCRAIANRCDSGSTYILACGGLDEATAVKSTKFCNMWYSPYYNLLCSTGYLRYANKQLMITLEYTKE